ncbi:MAG: response regulator [Polyangiaceae bacterium]|nr:response regulator [Polyangiaceae bacterium]
MKILVVDSDRERAKKLREKVSERDATFQVVTADTTEGALRVLDLGLIDAVVTQEKLVDGSGPELLGKVASSQPQVLRLLFLQAGAGVESPPVNSVAHQTLALASDETALLMKLRQCARIRELVVDPWLRKVVGQGDALPSPPKTLMALRRVLQKDDASAREVASVIEQDPALSASILRLATSAYFGLPRKIHSVSEAVMYVGLNTVKGLALSAKVFESFKLPAHCSFSLEGLQSHSLAVAQVARNLFDRAPKKDDAFLAGLFHDFGKLVLAARVPTMYAEVLRASADGQAPVHSVERELFGTTHSEVGAYLLALWGFPVDLVDAVLLHHTEFSTIGIELHLAVAVNFANQLAKGRKIDAQKEDTLKRAGVDVARGRWYAEEHRLIA